ncbi:MAG: response regulator transcription factor [Thermoleophilaceae bacterium]|jgi:DNA-binding NarL/FixJ family response regulator|nr:response regulator transcription factor [Thermoleophilaceae bacterium]
MPKRVHVVAGEFEDLVTFGLRRLLDDDASVDLVASDVSLERLEALLEEHEPAVALLNLGALPSASVVYDLQRSHPQTHIVVLANRPSPAEATQMLSFGAAACISKETQARDIITAIHLASRGMNMLPRSTSAGNGLVPPGPDLLTPREADVLELLQDGRTNAAIAHELSIGIETVRTHARNIYRKLGVASRRDLARLSRPETLERG